MTSPTNLLYCSRTSPARTATPPRVWTAPVQTQPRPRRMPLSVLLAPRPRTPGKRTLERRKRTGVSSARRRSASQVSRACGWWLAIGMLTRAWPPFDSISPFFQASPVAAAGSTAQYTDTVISTRATLTTRRPAPRRSGRATRSSWRRRCSRFRPLRERKDDAERASVCVLGYD